MQKGKKDRKMNEKPGEKKYMEGDRERLEECRQKKKR